MPPIVIWIIVLLLVAVAMFIAELFVPSGGLLAILATLCMVTAVVLCFVINKWLGTGVCVAILVIAPFAMAGGLNVWQRTSMGKKMVLSTTLGRPQTPHVLVGASGVALTELRPMGECEFGDTRIEATSELGMILPAGTRVKVLSVSGGVAVVRQIKEQETADARA